jgi:predicted RNA methylase
MEMLATGLVDEMQVLAINNLIDQGCISSQTTVVPFAQENYAALANTDFSVHGFSMRMVSHLWSHDDYQDKFTQLTERKLINAIRFNQKNGEFFSGELTFELPAAGEVNSICLSSRVLVDEKGSVALESTSSLSPLVLIPLPSRKFGKGESVSLAISYRFGGGFKDFIVKYS